MRVVRGRRCAARGGPPRPGARPPPRVRASGHEVHRREAHPGEAGKPLDHRMRGPTLLNLVSRLAGPCVFLLGCKCGWCPPALRHRRVAQPGCRPHRDLRLRRKLVQLASPAQQPRLPWPRRIRGRTRSLTTTPMVSAKAEQAQVRLYPDDGHVSILGAPAPRPSAGSPSTPVEPDSFRETATPCVVVRTPAVVCRHGRSLRPTGPRSWRSRRASAGPRE